MTARYYETLCPDCRGEEPAAIEACETCDRYGMATGEDGEED